MIRMKVLVALAIVVALVSVSAEAETRNYSLPHGSMVVESEANRVSVRFRMSAADFRTETRLNENGLPLFVSVSGTDVRADQVHEKFERKNTDAFFIAIASTPEELAILARALLRTADRRLPLLPHGEARLETLLERTFGDRTATLFAILGVAEGPKFVWLDEERNLFAAHESYGTAIREDARAHLAIVEREQKAASERWRSALLGKIAIKPAAVAITNARLFDPESGRLVPNTTIVVEGARIVRVGTMVAIPENAHRIDAGGKVVLPGLWDMHAHIRGDELPLHLAAGVTTVRDVSGGGAGRMQDLVREVNEGRRAGPRILTTQLLSTSSTIEAVREQIDACSGRCDGIKVYSNFPHQLLEKTVRYAHEKGLRVSGHIPAGTTASRAVAVGLDEIHHINQVMLNFMADVKKTDTPLRFTAVGERGGALDVKSRDVQAFLADLARRGTVVDPTVSVFELMFATRRNAVPPVLEKARRRIPVQTSRAMVHYRLVPIAERDASRYRNVTGGCSS